MGALLRNCTLKSVPQISLTDFEATWKENEIYCINKTKFTTFKICQADHIQKTAQKRAFTYFKTRQ